MARVTVEDCITKIPNRFELVTIAAQRSRDISAGAELTLERDDDKNPVVSLREVADELVDFDELKESLIKGLQKFVESEEPEVDEMDMEAIQQDLSGEPSAAEEVIEDVLTVHDVAAEELEREFANEAAVEEGGEPSDEI